MQGVGLEPTTALRQLPLKQPPLPIRGTLALCIHGDGKQDNQG